MLAHCVIVLLWTVSSLLNMDACYCVSLVVTSMVSGSYHEGVVGLSLSRLMIRRGVFATFLNCMVV